MKLGFFDSGIGGMTVLYEAIKVLPYDTIDREQHITLKQVNAKMISMIQ